MTNKHDVRLIARMGNKVKTHRAAAVRRGLIRRAPTDRQYRLRVHSSARDAPPVLRGIAPRITQRQHVFKPNSRLNLNINKTRRQHNCLYSTEIR